MTEDDELVHQALGRGEIETVAALTAHHIDGEQKQVLGAVLAAPKASNADVANLLREVAQWLDEESEEDD